jgi:hypothetical protein
LADADEKLAESAAYGLSYCEPASIDRARGNLF